MSNCATPFNMADVLADTPAASEQIFLHSAGSSLPPTPVVQRMIEHLHLEANVGGYTAEAMVAEELSLVRSRVAALFGDRATDAANRVALSTSAGFSSTQFVLGLGLGAGDAVLVSSTEFATNALATAHLARESGVRIGQIGRHPDGQIDLENLRTELERGDVRLVCLVTVPSDNGAHDDVTPAATLARAAGALVLIDTTQSIGQLPVDVYALGADAAVMNGRKWLRGPRGTGALWLRDGLVEQVTSVLPDHRGASLSGGAYLQFNNSRRFEYAEASVAAQLGLGVAAKYLIDLGIEQACAEVQSRAHRLRTGLRTLANVTVHDRESRQHAASAIVSFSVHGRTSPDIAIRLWESKIRVGVVPATASPLDSDLAAIQSVMRASPHYFVTPQQIDQALDVISSL